MDMQHVSHQNAVETTETEGIAFKRLMSQILLADPITSKGKEVMGLLDLSIDEDSFFPTLAHM